jgi:hypothetical protein
VNQSVLLGIPSERKQTQAAVGEFGRPRNPVKVETAGSNPVSGAGNAVPQWGRLRPALARKVRG